MFDPSTGSTAKLWLAWVQHAQCIILYGHVTKSFLHWGKQRCSGGESVVEKSCHMP